MLDQENIAAQLHTLRDYWRWGVSSFEREALFFGHGTDNASDEALYLICHALALNSDQIDTFMDARLVDSEKKQLLTLFERRIRERKPAAYLTREAWFAGLRFKVDERVLVPRSPIAELIEQGFEPWLGGRPVHRVLDMCTGSGCIGIACAYAFEEAEVVLSDISDDALAVARENIALHHLAERVEAISSDVFSGLEGRFDLIVSNPPYVDADDFAAMPAEYHAEPSLGLASGQDGLDVTRRILAGALDHLSDNGLLVVEVGNSWLALEEAFPSIPFTWIEFERGGHGVFAISREELEASGI